MSTIESRLESPPLKKERFSELRAGFTVNHNGVTCFSERYYTAPLRISRAFRPDGGSGEMHVYTTDVSPGVMDGDRYRSQWSLEERTHVILGSTSALRLHPTPCLPSLVEQSFHLAKGAILEYFPECVIPFRGSRSRLNTIFHLDPGAVLVYGDLWSAGRVHHGESFAFASYKSATEIWIGPDLAVWDHFVLEPGSGFSPHSGPAAMMNYTHTAALWIVAAGLGNSELDAIGGILASANVWAGASLLAEQSGIAVRMLGYSAEELQQCCFAVWNALRPTVIGKPPLQLRK